MEAEIINKVANSGLISFDLEEYFHQGERVVYDIKDNLFMGLILKEKDFREFLKAKEYSKRMDIWQ
jgi:signal-transduction protein with cAMP-binding, CBS, and nucleotidyltransferase domain